MPEIPNVNQEANKLEIKLSKSLKTGIDSAIIQAITQRIRVIPAQDPVARNVRFDI